MRELPGYASEGYAAETGALDHGYPAQDCVQHEGVHHHNAARLAAEARGGPSLAESCPNPAHTSEFISSFLNHFCHRIWTLQSMKTRNKLHVCDTLIRVEQKRNSELQLQLKQSALDINQVRTSCESLTSTVHDLTADKMLLQTNLNQREKEVSLESLSIGLLITNPYSLVVRGAGGDF